MKKFIAIPLLFLMICSALSACRINININQPTEAASPASTPADASSAPAATEAPVTTIETRPEAPVGSVESYVIDAASNTLTLDDGSEHVYRYPQIMLKSDDADDVNDELFDRFHSELPMDKDQALALTGMDYEAYLNGTTLSVITIVGYNGGNHYGAAYNFDVTTGNRLDNEAVANAYGMSYSEALSELREEATEEYDEKWNLLPGNDTERAKTLADDNIRAAVLYLDDDGDLMALVETFAAVGGGRFIMQVEVD